MPAALRRRYLACRISKIQIDVTMIVVVIVFLSLYLYIYNSQQLSRQSETFFFRYWKNTSKITENTRGMSNYLDDNAAYRISLDSNAIICHGKCLSESSSERVFDNCISFNESIDRFIDQLSNPGSCVASGRYVRCFPSFMIIGAMKAGTGVLMKALNHHKQPFFQSGFGTQGKREVHYFGENHLHLPLDRQGIIHVYEDYLNHFPLKYLFRSHVPDIITFDKTPDYMRDSSAMSQIKHLFPSMKFIIILRNPTDRAISGFNHNCRHKRYIRIGSAPIIINQTYSLPANSVMLLSHLKQYGNYDGKYQVLSHPCKGKDLEEYYTGPSEFYRDELRVGFYDEQIAFILKL